MISAKNIVILFIGLAIIYTDEHSLLFQHVYTVQQKHGWTSKRGVHHVEKQQPSTLFLRYLDGLRMSALRCDMWMNFVMLASLAALAIC